MRQAPLPVLPVARPSGRLRKTALARPTRPNSVALSVIPTDPADFDKQTADTIVKMIQIIKENVYAPEVIAATSQALRPLSAFASDFLKLHAIFHWIKRNVRFQDDYSLANEIIGTNGRNPEGEDFLIAPRLLLTMKAIKGDCDDFTMLGATMGLIAGFKVKLVTVAADASIPEIFSHVYWKAWDNQKFGWISFDASHGSVVGWEYQYSTRYKDWLIQ